MPRDGATAEHGFAELRNATTEELLLELRERLEQAPVDVAGVNAVRSLLHRLEPPRLEAIRAPA